MGVLVPLDQLATLSVFRGLSDEEVQRLLAQAEDVTFPAGAAILEAGGEQRALWLLLEGSVKIKIPTPGEPDHEIGQVAAPAVFGEVSFFHPGPHSATVECVDSARLVRLDRAAYDTLLSENQLAAYKLAANAAELLASRLQETDHWISEFMQQERNDRVRNEWRRFRENFSFGRSSGVRGLYGN